MVKRGNSTVRNRGRKRSEVSIFVGNRAGACEHGMGKTGQGAGLATKILLITLPLITLLISFHPWFSPALAAGENPPLFDWPVRGKVTVPFRPPSGPYWQGGHAGIDIEVAPGTEVKASADGMVSFAGFTPVGLCVSLEHGGGFRTTYVALRQTLVRKGERVRRGQVIASSDGTQDRSSNSHHLHFGMYLHGKPVDPLPFLSGFNPDPRKCLFLGPCEERPVDDGMATIPGDSASVPATGDGGGVTAGKGPLGRAWDCLARGARAAWDGVRDWLGGFFKYRVGSFLAGVGRRIASAGRTLLSNPYVRGVLAGLLAALVVCAVIITGGLALGISAAALAVACVAGGLASLGYSLYLAASRGGDFSLWGCFSQALLLGLSVGTSTLLFHYLAPFFASGYSSLGLLGSLKSFVAYGSSSVFVYLVDSLVKGRKPDLRIALFLFFTSGFAGSLGKTILQGFSSPFLPALAGGGFSVGGDYAAVSFSWLLASDLSEKASFVLLSGCLGFLSDFVFRLATGTAPSALEAALAFTGGCLAGTLAVTVGARIAGKLGSKARILDKLARSDFLKGLATKGAGHVARDASDALRGDHGERDGETRLFSFP